MYGADLTWGMKERLSTAFRNRFPLCSKMDALTCVCVCERETHTGFHTAVLWFISRCLEAFPASCSPLFWFSGVFSPLLSFLSSPPLWEQKEDQFIVLLSSGAFLVSQTCAHLCVFTSFWTISWRSSWSLLCPASYSSLRRGCDGSPLSQPSILVPPPMIGTQSPGVKEHSLTGRPTRRSMFPCC